MEFSFNNTEIAFQSKSNKDLKQAHLLFSALGYSWLVNAGPSLVRFAFALGLPIKGIIKRTIFKQFCGGEHIAECEKAIAFLNNYQIGTILDYSVEGEETMDAFLATTEEIKRTIDKAAGNLAIPFTVFKLTGVAAFSILEKWSARTVFTQEEQQQFDDVMLRVKGICEYAYQKKVRIFIDAEESWIQPAIDHIAETMMAQFNKGDCIVYNTLQLYRHDRLEYLEKLYHQAVTQNYILGVKLVRGAYMEKERARASAHGYVCPIQPDKAASDRDYDAALKFCVDHLDRIHLCAGTHNEESSKWLTTLMLNAGIAKGDSRVYFSQLLGMSDHISFNLSAAGYNVAKYVPYGPVKSVLPYLIRRAQENSSAKGQAGRELTLIKTELQRRKLY